MVVESSRVGKHVGRQLLAKHQRSKAHSLTPPPLVIPPSRYKIEQELGTEIKPIPAVIEKSLYCA